MIPADGDRTALRRPRQPARARGGARRRALDPGHALGARRRLRELRRVAGRGRRTDGRARRRRLDPRQLGSLAARRARGHAARRRTCRRRSPASSSALGPELDRSGSPRCPRRTARATCCSATARRTATWTRSCPSRWGHDDALLDGVDARRRRLRPHAPAGRPRPQGGIHLLNPGSVGLPFDGDTRAHWAVLHDDGRVELAPRGLRPRRGGRAACATATSARPGSPGTIARLRTASLHGE